MIRSDSSIFQQADTPSHPRGAIRPSSASSRHPLIQEGAGKAGCRLAPTVRCAKSTRRRTAQQHTGVASHSAFPARWFDGLCRALPGAELSFWPPSPRELDDAVRPVGLAHISATGLTVATTARTTRFCRTQSAPLVRTWPRAHRDYPPCPHLSRTTLPRPPQPGSHIVTTYDRPSRMAGMADIYDISEFR